MKQASVDQKKIEHQHLQLVHRNPNTAIGTNLSSHLGNNRLNPVKLIFFLFGMMQ